MEKKHITKKELAARYAVHRNTLRAWVKRLGAVIYQEFQAHRLLPPRLVAAIENRLG